MGFLHIPLPMRAFSRVSIEWKLPVLTGGLLALVILALSLAAYLEARRSAIVAAEGRLSRVTRQLVQAYEGGMQQLVAHAAAVAGDSAIRAYLQSPDATTHAAASGVLAALGPSPDLVVAVELVDRIGLPLLASGAGAGRVASLRGRRRALAGRRADSTVVGSLVPAGDTAVYAVLAPVPGTGGRHVVAVWRYLVSPAAVRAQTAELIGSQAELFLGDPETGTWTDLARLRRPPPVSMEELVTPAYYLRADTVRVARAIAIQGTPWFALLEFSRRALLAPLRSFVTRLSAIAGLVFVIGLGAAWVTSRGITRPILELTEAAEAMRADDYSRRVGADRTDELGRLATAFNQAAERVQEAQATLEEKVADRTRALERAQEALVRREKLAVLGLLAGGLSHELRNPLGVMTNAVYYLDGVLVNPPPHVKRYLRILQEQIERAERILGGLIDFVGVEPPQREPVSPSALIELQLERLPVPDTIRIRREFSAGVPPADVDPSQIGQVILNLLTNAVQAMADQPGELTVRVRAHDGEHVRIDISDTGPGIPA
ncbi:MAG TPA: HAMP domain-containing protein, partial [Gemmatimonadales bacterium]|nr:HAMP domain-containing protein [Gemmatimonadales bacterium]